MKHTHTDTETQRHRDTETQKHRDIETQRHRDTETQRHKGTETHTHTHTDRQTDTERHRETLTKTHRDTQRRYMTFSSQFHKSLCSLKDIDSAKLRSCYSRCELLFVVCRYACVSTHVFLSSKLCRVASSVVMLLRTPSNDPQVELRLTKCTLFRDRDVSYVSACTNCSKINIFYSNTWVIFCFENPKQTFWKRH